jgi:cytochrome c
VAIINIPNVLSSVAVATAVLLTACGNERPDEVDAASIERGRELAERVGCGSCHRIPGIPSANGEVGPPLDQLARRAYIAGIVPNDFENLAAWIARPQAFAPGSAMPNMGLTEAQARDIASYLYTLR